MLQRIGPEDRATFFLEDSYACSNDYTCCPCCSSSTWDTTDADIVHKQDPEGDIARAVLQPAAEHLGQQLTAARSTLPAELHNPLNQLGGVPYFALSRRSFLGACPKTLR